MIHERRCVRMSTEFNNRQVWTYIIVAGVFLAAGVMIGMNLPPDCTPYVPPEPETTSDGTDIDPTLAIIAGIVGSVTVMLVGGYVLLRRPDGFSRYIDSRAS
jgi:hypothetical protein